MPARDPVRVAVVGCGKISGAYLETLAPAPGVEVVACADADPARAAAAAAGVGARPATLADVLVDPAVELVLNLTPPAAHAEVALAAVAAGKHVYGEKPLATTRGEAEAILAAADAAGLHVGCAPETFLGAAWQRARALVDAGAIGRPVAARATMLGPGPEGWHPDPAFFYRPGGGPLLDMGPYYVAVLVALLGPVRRVGALARRTHATRPVRGGPRAGDELAVYVATHVAALLEWEDGTACTLVTSFDCWDDASSLELWGDEGTLLLPDPNFHGGPVRLRGRETAGEGEPVAGTGEALPYRRGDGVLDLAGAIRTGAAPRASGALGAHVLDVLLTILDAAEAGATLEVATTCARPAPLPEG